MKDKNNNRVKTPVLLQMEATECGAASLGIVIGYYGRHLTLEKLRQIANVSRNGSNAENILKAGEQLGFTSTGFSYPVEDLKKVIPPVIIHWEFNHFVVYEGYDEKKDIFFINDPAAGHRKIKGEEFEGSFTGVTLVLRPKEDFVPDPTPEPVWHRFVSSLMDSRQVFTYILLVGAGAAITNLFYPVISQVFFDEVLTYRHRHWLFEILLGIGIVFFLRTTTTFLKSWCLIRWQNKLTIDESTSFLAHVLKLPLDFFQQRFSGEIASRVQYNEAVVTFVTGKLANTLLDTGIALFYLFLLLLYDVQLTMVTLGFTVINCILTYYINRWVKEQYLKIQQETGRMYGLSVAGLSAMETLKANGNEADFFVKWANYNTRYISMQQEMEYYGQFISFIPAVLSALTSAMVMAIGGFNIMDGFMTLGVFLSFNQLSSSFQQPVSHLLSMTHDIQQAYSQLSRLDDVRNYPAEDVDLMADFEKTSDMPLRLTGELEFKNVSFCFSGVGKAFLKVFNLHLMPGQRIALVGQSGSGKSTVARLAAGFYEPWSGEILFDGHPRKDIHRQVLANSIALVEQSIHLYKGTIAENISLFDSTIPRSEIIQAAKDAAIHEEITALPGGYDAIVEEGGANFSGGQRQRLEIARALASKPSLLILDEATSALDTITEKLVMDNIRRRGCSCLIVAHRLSTVRDCDEIIVLKKGWIKQRGTHQELASVDGIYADLIRQ